MGEPLEAYLKMDLVVESPAGNIIVECKALTQLTEKEHYQTFGYLRATKYPIAILVNFGAERRAQIERFHFCEGKLYVFWGRNITENAESAVANPQLSVVAY